MTEEYIVINDLNYCNRTKYQTVEKAKESAVDECFSAPQDSQIILRVVGKVRASKAVVWDDKFKEIKS